MKNIENGPFLVMPCRYIVWYPSTVHFYFDFRLVTSFQLRTFATIVVVEKKRMIVFRYTVANNQDFQTSKKRSFSLAWNHFKISKEVSTNSTWKIRSWRELKRCILLFNGYSSLVVSEPAKNQGLSITIWNLQ